MKRRFCLSLISILMGIFISIVALETLFRLLPVHEGAIYLAVNDQSPVRRYQENRNFISSKGWNFSIVARKHSNNYGFLHDQDYQRDHKTPLMAIVGDSYVQAGQVEHSKTMRGLLAKKVGKIGRVYSFGASGSQLPTYLSYAKYARDNFNVDAFVFIIIDNDFDQSLFKYKNTPGLDYFSPNEHGGFSLIRIDYQPTLVKKAIRESALIRYLFLNLELNSQTVKQWINFITGRAASDIDDTGVGATDERVLDSKKAVDEFFRQLPLVTGLHTNDTLFVVDGMRPHLYSDSGLKEAKGSYFDVMRNYFMRMATREGYEVIDMQPLFIEAHRAHGSRFEFPTDRHWSALGYRLVVEAIAASSLYSRVFSE